LKLESLPPGVRLAVEAAQSKKAGGVTVLDLNGVAAFTDYFVICTGYSTPQLKAIFGGFIVHVFGEQARRFYDLERLWRSAPSLVLPDEPVERDTDRRTSGRENYLQQ
jgi:ribosome-associated protein